MPLHAYKDVIDLLTIAFMVVLLVYVIFFRNRPIRRRRRWSDDPPGWDPPGKGDQE